MNRTINLYVPILLYSLAATDSLYSMEKAVLVAANQVISSNDRSSGSPGLKKLNLESLPRAAECCLCTANKSLVAFFGCVHLFCKSCKDKRHEKTCPICSVRKKDCAICRESLTDNRIMLICDHVFHKDCLAEWQRKALVITDEATCPECRSQIFDKSEVQCMYCRNYFTYNPNNKAFRFQCTVPKWFLFKQIVNHYMHQHCLLEYIRTNSRRVDGKDVFRCLVHNIDHQVPILREIAASGIKSIEREEDVVKRPAQTKQKTKCDGYHQAVKKTGL